MYKERRRIELGDSDFLGNIKPEVIFTRFDEIATQDALEVGIYNKEMAGKYGWVVSKQTLRFYEPIQVDDVIDFTTEVRLGRRVIFPRYYALLKDEKKAAENFSIWTLLDLKKRRFVRPESIGLELPAAKKIEEEPRTLLPLEDGEFVESYIVRYSDIDTNGHMNNTRYIRHACDLIDLDYYRKHLLKEISINYKQEVLANEKLDLYMKKTDNTFLIEGRKEDDICFMMEMVFIDA